jgi:hypothetical protein
LIGTRRRNLAVVKGIRSSSSSRPSSWEHAASPTFQPREESVKRSVKPKKRDMVVAVASTTSVRQRPVMGRIIQEKIYKGGYGRKQNLVFGDEPNLSVFR